MIDKYYTLKEIEATAGIPYGTLRTCLRDGRLKANKVAGKWRTSESDLKKFLNPETTPRKKGE